MHTQASFPTWVLLQHWWGKEVIAFGNLEESNGSVPIKWLSEKSFSITFIRNKINGDDENDILVVKLP